MFKESNWVDKFCLQVVLLDAYWQECLLYNGPMWTPQKWFHKKLGFSLK